MNQNFNHEQTILFSDAGYQNARSEIGESDIVTVEFDLDLATFDRLELRVAAI